MILKPGLVNEVAGVVTPEECADQPGNGSPSVYAPPSVAVLMEKCAAQLLDRLLDEAHTSVGVFLTIHHMAATPVELKVTCKAEVTYVNGREVRFFVRVFDEKECIGSGEHTREIVDCARFSNATDKNL